MWEGYMPPECVNTWGRVGWSKLYHVCLPLVYSYVGALRSLNGVFVLSIFWGKRRKLPASSHAVIWKYCTPSDHLELNLTEFQVLRGLESHSFFSVAITYWNFDLLEICVVTCSTKAHLEGPAFLPPVPPRRLIRLLCCVHAKLPRCCWITQLKRTSTTRIKEESVKIVYNNHDSNDSRGDSLLFIKGHGDCHSVWIQMACYES